MSVPMVYKLSTFPSPCSSETFRDDGRYQSQQVLLSIYAALSISHFLARTLKAQTEKFSARVKCLEERVKELEGALLEAIGSTEHPLLQDQASSEKDINEVSEGIGALIVSEDGRTRYQGEGAASEVRVRIVRDRRES